MFLLDYRGLMTTLVLDFGVFVTAKCGLADYTGAEVKVNPKSRFAQYSNKKLLAHPTIFYLTSYNRLLAMAQSATAEAKPMNKYETIMWEKEMKEQILSKHTLRDPSHNTQTNSCLH